MTVGKRLRIQLKREMENRIYNEIQMRVATPFSASLAMAFFPNYFASAPTTFSGSTKVPCNLSVTVNSTELALRLPAIAFWYLRENNLIRLTLAAKEGLIFNRTPVVLEINHSNQQSVPGLEYDLMEIAKHLASGATVEQVVHQFFEKTVYYPQKKIYQRMTQWMIQLGYGPLINADPLTPEEAKRWIKARNIKSFDFRFAPDCQRVAATQSAAQLIHQGWTKFQTEEPELFRAIGEQCERALKYLTRPPRDSDMRDDYNSDYWDY